MLAFLFYLLWLRRYEAKRVKTRCLQEGVGHLEPRFQGEVVAIRQCKLHRATCRRFDTIPACARRTDGQTDGTAIASTALAMPALRRAVKKHKEKFFGNILL